MEGTRSEQAVRRIEAALSRIEAAADAVASGSATDGDIARRHQALRGVVTATLAELDQLIEGLQQ